MEKPRSEEKTKCRQCTFWLQGEIDLSLIAQGFGTCRRYPPQINIMSNGMEFHKWPVTKGEQWCGEAKIAIQVVDA